MYWVVYSLFRNMFTCTQLFALCVRKCLRVHHCSQYVCVRERISTFLYIAIHYA